ncbi:MAG: hypothetical protein ACTSRZ_10490 [Promethearchaeota archaeon]
MVIFISDLAGTVTSKSFVLSCPFIKTLKYVSRFVVVIVIPTIDIE